MSCEHFVFVEETAWLFLLLYNLFVREVATLLPHHLDVFGRKPENSKELVFDEFPLSLREVLLQERGRHITRTECRVSDDIHEQRSRRTDS